jgi:cyclopropane-fatty-acyl-phospholipid synthase
MSTQTEVDVSYGVSNDFFRLWLDRRMNYTCARFEDLEQGGHDFEAAQDNKLRWVSKLAGIDRHTHSVLDIGCGWGANLEYQATVNKVPDVHGFTLCQRQFEFCRDRNLPNTTVTCEDYRDYEPTDAFDAVTCICMMEHIARPEDARSGRHIELYRDFFQRIRTWTRPGAHLAVQVITRNRVPRKRQDLDEIRHANDVIFPGGMTLRVEDLVIAANPAFEVMEMHSLRRHYQRTCEHWLHRLQHNRQTVLESWGDDIFADYERYLQTCIRAFEKNWQSLHQFSLRRVD